MSYRAVVVLAVISLSLAAQTTIGTITYQDQLGAPAIEQNFRFSKLDSGAAIPARLSYRSHRVLNAAGTEVPWQQMSNGDLMVRTAVSASIFPHSLGTVITQPSYLRGGQSCTVNTAVVLVAFTGGSIPSGFATGTPYFIASCGTESGYFTYQLSTTYNGTPITSYSGGFNYYLYTVPFVTSGATFTSLAHGYVNGNVLQFAMTDNGALPGGLSANTNYFVCDATADTFQVSTTVDCASIVTTTSAATGIPAIMSTVSWRLQSGTPTTATTSLSVAPVGNYVEITNGLLGVRVPTVAYQASHSYGMAPIQALKLADGSWTPAAGNMGFDYRCNTIGSPAHTTGTGYTLTYQENGLLEVSLKASMTVNRAGCGLSSTDSPVNFSTINGTVDKFATTDAASNTIVINSYYFPDAMMITQSSIAALPVGMVVYPLHPWVQDATNTTGQSFRDQVSLTPGGPPIVLGASGTIGVYPLVQQLGSGFYHTTITVDSNSKVIQVVGDGNIHNYVYRINWRPNLVGNTARYRWQETSDRTRNLNTGTDQESKWLNSPDFAANWINKIGSQYQPNDSDGSTGHYWFAYNSTESATGNVIGFMLGSGSKQSWAEKDFTGPGLYDLPSTSSQGIVVSDVSPQNNFWSGEVVRSWGIWITTQADLAPTNQVQKIDPLRNSIFGIGAYKWNQYTLSYPDPPGGWQYLYTNDAAVAQTTALLEDSTSLCGTGTCLYNQTQAIATDAPIANQYLDQAAGRTAFNMSVITDALQAYGNVANGAGNLDPTLHKYQGLYPCMQKSPLGSAIVKSPALTAWRKAQIKAFWAYCYSISADGDYYSTDPSVGGGLVNQQSQFAQEKAQLALQIPSHPSAAQRLAEAQGTVLNNLLASISDYGASYASDHYTQASTEAGIMGMLGLVNNGRVSLSAYPKFAKFGEWYLSGLTPPEVRYNNSPRTWFGNGDGAGGSEALLDPGLLAGLLSQTSPTLAANLSWAWRAQTIAYGWGTALGTPTIAGISFVNPLDPHLTTQHIPGYRSMFRSGWGTSYENAVDYLYGGFYSAQGHAHRDTGRVAMYLLGAPVSLDWNANLYNPQTDGGFYHSRVVLDSDLGSDTWSEDNPPYGLAGTWSGSSPDTTTLVQTSSFSGSSSAIASWAKTDGTTWQRSVQLFHYDANFAVVHLVDTFSGAQASSAKTYTMNLVTTDEAVTTPSGPYTPIVRRNLSNNGVRPSNGTVNTLSGNGIKQFAFTGAVWLRHASGGVDFDLYTQNADTYSWLIGNWCTDQDAGVPGTKTCATQRQDIIRLHGTGGFDTWIVARKKGASDPAVSAGSCGAGSVQIALAGTLCFDAYHSQYDDGAGTQSLATYGTAAASAFGMTISGGPAEAVKTATEITLTIHGYSGSERTISLPAGYYPQQATGMDASGNVRVYTESAPLTLRFSTTPLPQRNVRISAPSGGTKARLKMASNVNAATPYLVTAVPGSTITIEAAPGTYQAQWVMDTGQTQVFSISVH